MPAERVTVAWIGTGKMGGPMARRLLAAGWPVVAVDPSEANVASVLAAGGRRAASPAGAARQADIAFTMLPDDDSLRAVALGDDGVLAGLPAGAVFVDMSTVSPAVSAEVRTAAQVGGVDFLAAPVAGSTQLAETGGLGVMASGPLAAYERAAPLLDVLAKSRFRLGPGEEGRWMKLCLNLVIAQTAVAWGEALAIGRKGGVDWQHMLDVFAASAIASPFVGYKAGPLARRDFAPAFAAKQMHKDMRLLAEAADSAGVPAPATELARATFAELVARGWGDDDLVATVKLSEGRAGLDEP
ncbi:MAG: NAD(P)-dependent oxidoreductase [Alphaproteobacteria bacterium]